MTESLNGKVAVITGVGSGFAKATAELFAQTDQVSLVLIDRNEEALKATADVCKTAGSKVVAIAGDVTKLETFTRAFKETMDTFGRVDFLLNYAASLDIADGDADALMSLRGKKPEAVAHILCR